MSWGGSPSSYGSYGGKGGGGAPSQDWQRGGGGGGTSQDWRGGGDEDWGRGGSGAAAPAPSRVAPPSRGGYGQPTSAPGGYGASGARVVPLSAGGAQGAAGAGATITVSGCQNPTVSNIIKGTFAPNGANHGKPVYKKEGSGSVSVLIYYWDERDGPTFSGWWFGPKVGGDQVWAYNGNRASPTPPLSNWKVPWDGNVDPSLQLTTGGSGGGGYGAPVIKPQVDVRAQQEERKRQEAEQQRREEERRRTQEEAMRRKKERDEENARREAEAAQKRKEEEQRRKEQAAALAVRKVIQRVRIATPETYDNLRNELEEAQAEHLENMGSQAEKVSQEAEKALQQAQQRIDDIAKKREDDERKALEDEKRRKEEVETVERLMQELKEELIAVEAKVEEAQESGKTLSEDAEATPDEMLAKATATEKVIEAGREVVAATEKSFTQKREEMGNNEASRKVRDEIRGLQDKLSTGRRALAKLSDSVKLVHEKASRKAAALKKNAEREAEFEKHDLDKDGKLSSKEVVEFAKNEYEFEVSEDTLAKIMRILEPVVLDKFQRMRGMVAIAKSEKRARQLRAEEEEKRRIIEERRTAMQTVLDEISEILGRAEATLSKAQNEAQPVSRGRDDIPAEELKTIASSIEALSQEGENELAQALEKLQKAEEDCNADEALGAFIKREVPKMRQRVERLEGRIEKLTATQKSTAEKAVQKAYAEMEKLRAKVVTAIRVKMSTDDKTKEQLFESVSDGEEELSKDKFVTFLEGLDDLKLGEGGRAEKFFRHVTSEDAGSLSKDQFNELIRLYYKVVKSTVLTETISIKSKTVRRLEMGEVLECIEGPAKEDGANVQRVRCQSVNDEQIGWVTIEGNQGTPFLEPGGNFYSVVKETVITDGLSVQDSKTIRRVSKGEVIEVLEFGKKDVTVGVKRIRGKAKQDGVMGWITISGNQGTSFLEPC